MLVKSSTVIVWKTISCWFFWTMYGKLQLKTVISEVMQRLTLSIKMGGVRAEQCKSVDNEGSDTSEISYTDEWNHSLKSEITVLKSEITVLKSEIAVFSRILNIFSVYYHPRLIKAQKSQWNLEISYAKSASVGPLGWQRRVFSACALFANSTLTSRAAYSYSRGYSKVPQTWAEGLSLWYFGIKHSFRRASLSNVMALAIFE